MRYHAWWIENMSWDYKLLRELIYSSEDLLSADALKAVWHYYNQDEWEIAFEGLLIELIKIRPNPGIPKTCSIIILPAIISANAIPRKVTSGIMAFLRIWPYKT